MLPPGLAWRRSSSFPSPTVTPERVLDEWDANSTALEDIVGPIAILNNVHPDKAVRDAADAAMRDISSFHVEVLQNEALFERVRAVAPQTRRRRS